MNNTLCAAETANNGTDYLTSFESFKARFFEDLKDKLPGVELSIREVKKLNESYEGIVASPVGSNVGVNIPIEMFFKALEDGRDYDEVVEKGAEFVTNGITQRPDFDIDSFCDYSKMKEKIALELVSAERNKELLETVPHQMLEDMAVVCRFVVSSDNEGRASILVTNQMLESMGVTPKQLFEDAMEIAPMNKPAEIKGMFETLCELMGGEPDMLATMGILPMEADDRMYVASVPDKIQGAAVLAYPGFFDQAAEKIGKSFYILPSSIHECILVPDEGTKNGADVFLPMVREVNSAEVQPEDRLTDNVYHYDIEEKIFESARNYEKRRKAAAI
jgi:hypothetical protein